MLWTAQIILRTIIESKKERQKVLDACDENNKDKALDRNPLDLRIIIMLTTCFILFAIVVWAVAASAHIHVLTTVKICCGFIYIFAFWDQLLDALVFLCGATIKLRVIDNHLT